MGFGIDSIGIGFGTKAEKKNGYNSESLKEGAKRREEVAYASLPGLLNGSSNPPTQGTQTAFNA